MTTARILVALIGITLPYAVRFIRGQQWLAQYTDIPLGGQFLFASFNALAWGSIIAASLLYRHAISILSPSLFGFSVLAYGHYGLDLAADAQAGISLLVIPVYSCVFTGIGALLGYYIDRAYQASGANGGPPLSRTGR